RTAAVDEPRPWLAQLGVGHLAHEERVVAGVVLGPDAAVEPCERAGEPPPDPSGSELDAVPHRERRDAVGEVAGERVLPAGEEADPERPGPAEERECRLPGPDRDPDERRPERDGDKR